jgi:ATP-dependent DNA helicase RecQ
MFARDADAPEEVKDACVRLLSGWRNDWPSRPEIVVDLPAAGYHALTRDVADHLAGVGRLDRSSLDVADGPSAEAVREMGSAEEAAMWRDRLTVPESGAVEGRSVLLVVDATSSLWPVTVASALLRRAGAAVVLPLVLHRRP